MPTSVSSKQDRKVPDIHIVRGQLPAPEANECLALAIRIDKERRPIIGSFEKDLFRRMNCMPSVRLLKFPNNQDTIRVSQLALYLFSISSPGGQPDRRYFSQGFTNLLNNINPDEFNIVRTRLPFPERRNSGSFWTKLLGKLKRLYEGEYPMRFWLMEMIHAYGVWRRGAGAHRLLEMSVHLTDPGVLFDVATGRIDPLELLMCDDLRFTVEIEHNARTLVSESYQCRGTVTLRELAKVMGVLRSSDRLQTAHQLRVEVDPSPTGYPLIRTLASSDRQREGLDTSLSELGVVTDCVLRFVYMPTPDDEEGTLTADSKDPSPIRKPATAKKPTASKKRSARKRNASSKKK